MKKLIINTIIFTTLFYLTACCHEPEIDNINLYGTVQEKVSGDWLRDVVISSDSVSIGNVITGSDGHFTFKINSLEKPIINLIAQKLNYEADTQMLNLNQLKNSGKRVDFQLLRSSIIYSGSVIDAQTQQPINNAKVHAKIKNGSYIAAVSTVFADENGQYFLELYKPKYDSWTYYITASSDNYQVETRTLNHSQADIGKTFDLDFLLEKK